MDKIVILSFLIFILALSIKMKVFPNGDKVKILILFISYIIGISINTGYHYLEYNGESILRVPVWFIVSVIFGVLNFLWLYKKEDRVITLLLLFIIINLIIWRPYISDIVKYYNFIYVYVSILFIYLILSTSRNITLDYVLNITVGISILNSILGILQYYLNKKLLIGVWDESILFLEETGGVVKRIVGFAGTNNAAGTFGAILFCIVLYKYLKDKKLIYLIALILNSIFSILTLTRIGYLAIFIQLIIFYAFKRSTRISQLLKKYSIFIFATLIVLIILIFFGDKIYEILFLNRGHTANYRNTQFKFVINNIIKYNFILGVGPGQLNSYILNKFGFMEMDLHSQYLNVLAEQGILIFVCFIIFNIYIFKIALSKCEDNLMKCLVYGIFITSLVCFNFNPNQYYQINNIIYYTLMFSIIKFDFVREKK